MQLTDMLFCWDHISTALITKDVKPWGILYSNVCKNLSGSYRDCPCSKVRKYMKSGYYWARKEVRSRSWLLIWATDWFKCNFRHAWRKRWSECLRSGYGALLASISTFACEILALWKRILRGSSTIFISWFKWEIMALLLQLWHGKGAS